MSGRSGIEWTESTWNPVTGCSSVSPACDHCYARAMARRLRAAGNARYAQGFDVRMHEDLLQVPTRWRRPRRVFVCSMGDLFHPRVSDWFIARVLLVMNECPRHTFQILTKRPSRASDLLAEFQLGSNIWVGTTIERDEYCGRADSLRNIPARVRFLSLEPLLGPLPSLDLSGIHWVIVGGETGPHARFMETAWVREIRDRCKTAGIPLFFKRWGGRLDRGSRYLDGEIVQEWPR